MNWLAKRRLLLVGISGGMVLMLSVLLLALAARAGVPSQGQGSGTIDDFGTAPAFTLTDQLGRPVSSDMFRGKIVIANFIYTSCTDICPLLSTQMQSLQGRLRQENLLGNQVQLLSFSVDPVRDTPPVLRNYAERHKADPDAWRFLTGPEETVKPLIVDGFHLGAQALPPPTATNGVHSHSAASIEEYEVMHSGRFVLIDQQGYIRTYYDGQAFDVERVLRDIHGLLQ
ncbi:MAG: SCO family protein [Roseiflexaceae bacterium]